MSNVPTTGGRGGWKDQIEERIKNGTIRNDPSEIVTILSGSHGNEKLQSAFTDYHLREPELFREDDDLIYGKKSE